MRVLVTGASGFVGGAVVARIAKDTNLSVRAAVRGESRRVQPGVDVVRVGNLGDATDWSAALSGVDIVVHTAARVHVLHDTVADPLHAFRRANVAGTLRLAQQAASAGARRFIFVSSIKVNGEETQPGGAFGPDDRPAPRDPYGISKREAEDALRSFATKTEMAIVIVRPVLVYGPGVKANFLAMLRWLDLGVPLPFGAVHNRRSLVALDNLTDLIHICMRHPAAANQTFLVSDGEDLSTAELLRRAAAALGRRARLLSVPPSVLELGARLLGRRDLVQRLVGSLQVDTTKTRSLLGWVPPVSVDDALARTARWYRAERVESHRDESFGGK